MRTFGKALLIVILSLGVLIPVGVYLGVGPSLSCLVPSRGPLETGPSTRVVLSGGRDRCYLLYAPPSVDPADETPVLLALHGFAGNPQGLRSMTGWEDVADREGFLAVFPHGSSFPLRWNTSPAFHIEDTDDVQFIADILDDLSDIATVDESRVYVTGFSNGAGMTDLIACELSDRVAAVAMVQGKGEGDPAICSPAWPVPVIAFFGLEDPIDSVDYPLWFFRVMNLSPDPQYREVVPFPTWAEGWARRNGCDDLPQQLPPQAEATAIRYSRCDSNADVVIYTLEGGGHTWPGGWNLPFFGEVSASVNASALIWEFFENHPRVEQPPG